jgi:hypothetical protein
MSATSSTQASTAQLLPPPPQAVANIPPSNADARFSALLNIIGGKRTRRTCRTRRTHHKKKRRRSSKRHSKRRSRSRKSRRRTRRYSGGNQLQIAVATTPMPYNDHSYPGVTAMQTQLAGVIAQNNANAETDKVGPSPTPAK